MIRIVRNASIICIACIVVGLLLVTYMVQPTQTGLDLSYQKLSLGNKIAEALLNQGMVTLSNQDVSNLFKENLEQKKEEKQVPISGAKLTIESHTIHGWVELQKGILPIEISFLANVKLDGQTILITPTKYWVGKISMQPDTFHKLLQVLLNGEIPSVYRVQLPLPPGIGLQQIQIESGQVSLQFSLKRIF